jgi:hypothetical protein
MEQVGHCGGESSRCSTHPVIEEAEFTSSEAASHTTGPAPGWSVIAFVSNALSRTPGVFWQQPCDAGIAICPHWLFITWQQARSLALICASGTMQAIAGATHDTSKRTITPNWRRRRIPLLRLRLPAIRCKQRYSALPICSLLVAAEQNFQSSTLSRSLAA